MRAFILAALGGLFGMMACLTSESGVVQAASGTPTAIIVNPAAPTSAKGRLALSARLTTADGKPLSNQSITFFLHVDLFGDREALLGVATTDSTGLATISYQPAQAGRQTIAARFAGVSDFATSNASAEIQVDQAVPALQDEPLPFAGLRERLPAGLVVLVMSVWVVLLGVFVGTVRGIRRATQP
jgi:hypothetical protein